MKKTSYYYRALNSFLGFQVRPENKILAIGLNTGQVLAGIAAQNAVGLELSEASLNQQKEQFTQFSFYRWSGVGPLPAALASQRTNPSQSEKFDTIILVNACGYWQDIQQALELLKPLCHRDTRIIATTYNILWSPVFALAQKLKLHLPRPALNWLSLSDIENFFNLTGYRVVKKYYRVLLPVNLGPLAQFCNRWLSTVPFINALRTTNCIIARLPQPHDLSQEVVSVVIPARNEKGNIVPAIERLNQVVATRREKYEIIFVEGNSTDNTAQEIERVLNDPTIAKNFKTLFLKQPGKGKGDAVRTGFAAASGTILTILDADLTVPPEDLVKFVDVYAQDLGEFINGCRLIYAMEKAAMRPLNLIGNKFFGSAFTWLLNQRFKDTLCGTKMLSRTNYQRLVANRTYFGNFDPFGDFDLIFGASKLNLEIVEVPIRYRERTYGDTNIQRWRHGWLLLKMCVYALNKIKFIP